MSTPPPPPTLPAPPDPGTQSYDGASKERFSSRPGSSAPRSRSPMNQGASRSLRPKPQALARPTPPEKPRKRSRKRKPARGKSSLPEPKRRNTAKTNSAGEELDDEIVVTGATPGRKDSAHSLAQLAAVTEHEQHDGGHSDVDAAENHELSTAETVANQPFPTTPIRQRDASVDSEVGATGDQASDVHDSPTITRQHPKCVAADVNAEEHEPSETDAEAHTTAIQEEEGGEEEEGSIMASDEFEILEIVEEDGKRFKVRLAQKPDEFEWVAKDTLKAPDAFHKWRQNNREKWDVIAVLTYSKRQGRYKVLWDCIKPGTTRLWESWEPKELIPGWAVDKYEKMIEEARLSREQQAKANPAE